MGGSLCSLQNKLEVKTVKRYYVKSPISGWHEVNKERFDEFVKNLRNGSINIPYEKKDEFIASKTKVIEG
jgi:hypothetical protein